MSAGGSSRATYGRSGGSWRRSDERVGSGITAQVARGAKPSLTHFAAATSTSGQLLDKVFTLTCVNHVAGRGNSCVSGRSRASILSRARYRGRGVAAQSQEVATDRVTACAHAQLRATHRDAMECDKGVGSAVVSRSVD